MRKNLTHKQIKASGWDDFLRFVIREKLCPNQLDKAVKDYEIRKALLKVAGDLEKNMYGEVVRKYKNLKIFGLSKQVKNED